ncbi:hypothetical protein J6590_088720 [Homalodisca vitripennis]|nr:hypothetical protein J6590_088720 [Homalodisca vitripennis]
MAIRKLYFVKWSESQSKQSQSLTCTFGDREFVAECDQIKVLGTLLDSNLKFCDHHITHSIQHLGRLTGLYGFRNLLQEFT